MSGIAHARQWVLSLLFTGIAYGLLVVYAIVFAPWALLSRKGAVVAAKSWAVTARWMARVMLGIRSEVRGMPPSGQVLIAAKHQSFLDIILIYGTTPLPRFIMKRELMYVPFFGQYVLRLGCIPVNRGKRAQAVKKMLADVAEGRSDPGQLVIYPQGTRVAPGVHAPYKIGTGALYREMGQPCVPVACNVGLFWPRRGILKKPGLAVVEYLPEIPPGLPLPEFMARLEREIEAGSDRLLAEAGFPILPKE